MDLESRAVEVRESFQRAVDAVRNDVKGLPHDAATERLLDAMRREDVYMPRQVVSGVARGLSDPWWNFRHPFRAWREMRHHEADSEGDRMQVEADELSHRISMLADLRSFFLSIQSRRTIDGQTHVVYIEPWSASMAQRIVDAAAPIPVDVRPATSN